MDAFEQYIRPKKLDTVLDALNSGKWTVAAGCTDLFPATERKVLPGPVLDITGVSELRGITRDDAGVWMGATTTWRDIINADLPGAFDGLKGAAREVGAMQIQNKGTLAGNLCNASPAADGVPPLLTLDAQVALSSVSGTRRLPLSEFLQGPRKTARSANELVTGVFIPKQALIGDSNFKKLGARKYLVISIAMCAARIVIDDGIVTGAALAIGSCGPVATRLPDVESKLVGHPLDAAQITDGDVAAYLSPIDDPRADADYRSHAAAQVMRSVVQSLERIRA